MLGSAAPLVAALPQLIPIRSHLSQFVPHVGKQPAKGRVEPNPKTCPTVEPADFRRRLRRPRASCGLRATRPPAGVFRRRRTSLPGLFQGNSSPPSGYGDFAVQDDDSVAVVDWAAPNRGDIVDVALSGGSPQSTLAFWHLDAQAFTLSA
jgi:hypothetical protein